MGVRPQSDSSWESKRLEQRDLTLPLPDLFDIELARRMWEELPPDCRVDHLDKRNMPATYRHAVRERSSGRGGRWTSQSVSFRDLPEPMTCEIAWGVHRLIELGLIIDGQRFNDMASCLRIAISNGSRRARDAVSLLHMSADHWVREAVFARSRDPDLPRGDDEGAHQIIDTLLDVLIYRYHQGKWWHLDVWNPKLDRRIPLRDHEPRGRNNAYFTRLTSPWLKAGAKLWLSTCLVNGRYSWSTVKTRLDGLKWLQRHIDRVGDQGPSLTTDPAALRGFVLGFCEALAAYRQPAGPNAGKGLAKNPRRQIMTSIEQFFQWMFDHRELAAGELGLPDWGGLRPELCVLFRPEDKPRLTNRKQDASMVLEDAVMTRIAEGAELLAQPKQEGGFGDVQAFHALMLLMRTGRRLNEVLMMDYEPLEPLLGTPGTDPVDPATGEEPSGSASAFVARMRYQQTKIDSGQQPSIPVDAEVVSIIRAQQRHAQRMMNDRGNVGHTPKYLFIRVMRNRNGDHPYPMPSMHMRLSALAERLAITDSAGRPVSISRTHQFRHTTATNLLNGGVPLHVVMRYFGHASADMTLHYAVTLAKTHEEQFLRFRKVTSDGRTAAVDPTDMLDLIQLDRRTDRVLPNGWCLLPPKQFCDKGNACLTCSRFVTDASHEAELRRQVDETHRLIGTRQQAFQARFGEPMGSDNVWLQGRQTEVDALNRILLSITDVSGHAVRGAGATA